MTTVPDPQDTPAATAARPPALQLQDVTKHYQVPGGVVRSVDGVSLTVGAGEIVGLVGESGSGKSTVGKMAVALARPTSGRVLVDGVAVSEMSRRRLRPLRRSFNIVFQDPGSSINPRMTVGQAVAEPLRVYDVVPRNATRARVLELLDLVGLPSHVAGRHPHELSGGQRQRVSLARALAPGPTLLVADEPTSALDVSVQASVLNVIADLQRDLGFACLFISHDLSSVEYLADRVAVMYLGKIIEVTESDALFRRPLHPYTEALLSAAPIPDPEVQRTRRRVLLSGELPSPIHPPSGCAFHPRCPLATDLCTTSAPPLRPVSTVDGVAHVACHLVTDDGIRPSLLGAPAAAGSAHT
ncbi:ABC transporter ATP-binding protein [Cellulomonas dongxiuzhuiae]|uniref:ABC transporter ATP-binding protein n=1 Tax=Cellulomonas dongxiuzhuiae TaxID=2819979 RepID=A0ABX8GKD6_9CELL|nr:ABC transporter ATP-binding protein [Cellulomonas dongxiuzhuiae]MBO3095174.1 ABC transporter ATP-binding protein [Cellulomonas dongxiuzhuiae]QWC16177.1 ABC transporter ATP-binding protein [Cellulomonas dongxiuzhuiae]